MAKKLITKVINWAIKIKQIQKIWKFDAFLKKLFIIDDNIDANSKLILLDNNNTSKISRRKIVQQVSVLLR